jgi:hypothetical protein
MKIIYLLLSNFFQYFNIMLIYMHAYLCRVVIDFKLVKLPYIYAFPSPLPFSFGITPHALCLA